MSQARFVGLLLFISADAIGQTLEPICSNPQGIHVVGEGDSVRVCFTLFNDGDVRLPQRVNFVAESRSDLGVLAINDVDYRSKNVTASIDFQGQDTLELCQTTEIINDEVAERTEYFTVTLHRRLGGELASCQVAITDRNGGPPNCYDQAIADIRLGQIVNDGAFCFMGKANDLKSGQCQQELDPNATLGDCTRWNQNIFNNAMAAEIITDQILPTIANADGECVRNVISGIESMYRAETGGPTPPPPRQKCATNCVLTVRNNNNCDTSVLLLEHVFRGEAINFLNDLRNEQPDVCTIGLECCDMSQPLPSICGDYPLPASTVTVQVTGTAAQDQSGDETVVIIAAVLGSILGLVLVGGAVALILFLILRITRSPPTHKEAVSAIQVGIDDHQTNKQDTNEYATIDRDSMIMMENNSAYMCNSTHHGQKISTDDNIAYYSSNRAKNEDDYVYEYI